MFISIIVVIITNNGNTNTDGNMNDNNNSSSNLSGKRAGRAGDEGEAEVGVEIHALEDASSSNTS